MINFGNIDDLGLSELLEARYVQELFLEPLEKEGKWMNEENIMKEKAQMEEIEAKIDMLLDHQG